ncbi:putative glutamine amidotransferase-like protein C13C5.04-like protein 2 [Colletotrichum chlorophyti]|uniref:Putative glutamine amidotransferase-like protein C13C5.04-like protein 2 n=1 Tax=Colletotrichum chlorophyti TaxID=708187 RepID=A0A1Q8RHF6_9PEZI|nr:putative glutamine amidotransferase-like protein C13C5.04-like protein 2 [Colletotrichum chlorophyti]
MGSMPTTTPLRVAIVKSYELDEPKHRGMALSFKENVLAYVPDAIVNIYRPLREEKLPNPEDYHLIIISGGLGNFCQDVYEPWVYTTLEWIREVVARQQVTRTRLVGVCWGHQAIAKALSGTIGMFEHPRVGVEELTLNEKGKQFFGKDKLKITKFHRRFVKDAPAGFKPLAHDNEILAADSGLVLSFQGHPEIYGELTRQFFEHDIAYYSASFKTEEDLQRYYAEMSSSRDDSKVIFSKLMAWAAS